MQTCRPRLAALVAAALLAAMAGPATAQQRPQAPPVDVAVPLEREIVDMDVYTGRFEAVQGVEIRARVSGYLEEIAFEDGAVVEKGALLFRIDQRTFQAAVERATAQLAAARATRELAEIELNRATRLAERNVGTAQEVDRSQATLGEAEAQVDVAQAELREAELNLQFTEIRAPISGRMSASAIDVGNLVIGGASGAQALSTVVSTDPIHFVFTPSEADFLRYSRLFETATERDAEAQRIEVAVRLMDEEDFVHRGRMDFVDNRLNPNSGTIDVRAVLENDDGLLVPGLFGRIRLPASRPYTALLLPDDAILSDQANKIVMTVAEDGTVGQKRITIGDLYRGFRIVRDGLSPDDRVVVNGVMRARPGGKVTPEPVELSLEGE